MEMPDVKLMPLDASDRNQFILDNQEAFNNHHPDPNDPDPAEQVNEQFPEGMFRFEKVMKP